MKDNKQNKAEIKRESDGKFIKGNSPKSPGRPLIPQEVKDMCRGYTLEAIETAISIMQNKKAQNKDRLKALEIILDRGYGKASQAITGGEGGEKPVQFTLEAFVKMMKD
jgi:hypothetical protein